MFESNVTGPWIHPDAASLEELAVAAARCPSGAIRVERIDGSPIEAVSGRVVVAVLENGPYAVRGAVAVDGRPETRATLCRCGASARKPYCDGSHHTVGFTATGELPAPATLPAWSEVGGQGPVAATPHPDGPLEITGPHEITCGGGRAARRAGRAFLCRCGGSGNKPLCDGTHRRNGFKG